jgi:hypothetical protein
MKIRKKYIPFFLREDEGAEGEAFGLTLSTLSHPRI